MKQLKLGLATAIALGASVLAGPALAEIDKLATYAEMRSIAAEQQTLRGVDSAQARYVELQTQFDRLKASMGGDDPTLMNEAAPGAAAKSASVPGPKVVPTVPVGMIPTTATFTQAVPVAISDVGVVTSTVLVSGAGVYTWDIDLTTNITHTFAADLDITLTSPAGTVVTLTTDNGAGNDNVFNGTLWDDDANPGGTVPYATNNGMVTDQAYVNLTLASPLVPEEALAAFVGEDPNGTWTITVSDDLTGDVGSIDSFSLAVTTFTLAPTPTTLPTATQATPVAIPTGPGVVTSTLLISGAGATLTDVNLTTAITHTFSADLEMTLTSPAGTIVTLGSDNAAGNDDVYNGTLWDDDANPGGTVPYATNNGVVTDHAYVNLTPASPVVPEEAMGAFIGEDPNGTWTLTINDDLAGDGGSLNSWSLDIVTGVGGCTLTCPGAVTVGNDAAQCGAVVNYSAPSTVGACGTVTCTPASGSFFAVGTAPSTCTSSIGNGTCQFDVTVNDTEAPVVTCPANISQPGPAGTVINYAAPTVNDNCAGASAACAPASGSAFPIGITTTTCTATDAATNTASCAFSISLFAVDHPIPMLGLVGMMLLVLLMVGLSHRPLQRL